MVDPSVPLQAAIGATLGAAITDVDIWDRVPLNQNGRVTAKFPYIRIGDDHIQSDQDGCHDPSTAYCTVHVWSRAVGKIEAKTIMARVCLALDTYIDVTGFGVIAHAIELGPLHTDDADGVTTHSYATFRYRLGPIT